MIYLYIDNNKVVSILEVSTFINTSSSDKIEFKILRNEKEISLFIIPKITDGKDAFGNSIKKKIIGIKKHFWMTKNSYRNKKKMKLPSLKLINKNNTFIKTF